MRICVGDLEGNGLYRDITKIHCGVFKDINTLEVFKFRPDQLKEMCKFLDTVDVLVMHNGIGYDFPVLKKILGYEYNGKKVDTLIMSRLLDPKRLVPFNSPDKKIGPHSIEAWGYRVGRGKPSHDDWETFSEEMLHRCTEDVEILHLVYNALLSEAKGKNWRNAFLLSFKLFEFLQKQEEYGWLVDLDKMNSNIRQLSRWVDMIDSVLVPNLPDKLEIHETRKDGNYTCLKNPYLRSGAPSQALIRWCSLWDIDPSSKPVSGSFSRVSFRKIDLNSNAETKDYLLAEGWEPLEWNTNDAGEKTSPKMSKDDPFEGINGKVGKLVARRVQCRQRKSIIEGLSLLVRDDGRIASVVNNLAVTGRATHRNVVNIPKAGSFFGKQMRKMFSSAKGKVLVGTDSDSCQLRMLGGRMGSEAYISAIMTGDKSKGTDLHSLTRKIGELESRDIAKNVMYCLLFGGGDEKLGKTAKLPGKGKDLRSRLYNGFDGLGELVQSLVDQWRSTAKKRYNALFRRMEYYDGYIIGLDGRPVQVPSEHALLVYLLQSDEAIMMSAAYVKANKDLASKYVYGKQYGFVCFYHDEYTVECDEDIAEDVKKICEDAIVWAGKFFNIKCPHVGDGKIGKNWFDIH